VEWLGNDAFGQVLEPGRVGMGYLGLLLLPPPPAGEPEAGRVLVVGPAALRHPCVPQPPGSLVYELLTGRPERQPHELVFLTDLTGELRRLVPQHLGGGRHRPQCRRPGGHRLLAGGDVQGMEFDDLTFEEARALERPAMTIVRG
jgi:hypothetical protein